MPALLIKDLPEELHRKLKEQAARHHRSMTREALMLLEQALSPRALSSTMILPTPIKPRTPISAEAIVETIRAARDQEDTNPRQ